MRLVDFFGLARGKEEEETRSFFEPIMLHWALSNETSSLNWSLSFSSSWCLFVWASSLCGGSGKMTWPSFSRVSNWQRWMGSAWLRAWNASFDIRKEDQKEIKLGSEARQKRWNKKINGYNYLWIMTQSISNSSFVRSFVHSFVIIVISTQVHKRREGFVFVVIIKRCY